MAESSSSGDEGFRGEAKYKQFSAAVERALKGFEVSSEWHDLISSLARLNKASVDRLNVSCPVRDGITESNFSLLLLCALLSPSQRLSQRLWLACIIILL